MEVAIVTDGVGARADVIDDGAYGCRDAVALGLKERLAQLKFGPERGQHSGAEHSDEDQERAKVRLHR